MTVAPESGALTIGGLSAAYRGRPVLVQLTLAPLPRGSITALVGPNGAGKSTLLRAIGGLVPARGRVALDGVDLLRLAPQARAAKVGFMPQGLPAGIGLTVLEAVVGALSTGAMLRARAQVERDAVAVLERLGLLPLALQPLDRLSGGQRQMASLAQAIAGSPPVLLLDEPTSALDLRHQLRLIEAVRQEARKGTIVLIALHDLSLAARWARAMIVLDGGRLVAQGPPGEVVTPAMLRTVYGVAARVERSPRGDLLIAPEAVVG